MRAIYCPGPEKWIPIAAYVKGVKLAKLFPDGEFNTGISQFGPHTGLEIQEQFWEGVQDRINQGIPYTQRGRKD